MRNLKKLLAVVVAICVLASFTIPAFAAESFTYETQAKSLYDMGLFKGGSTSTYVPNLGDSLTREAGIALLVRLLGAEKAADEMTDADTVLKAYTDASKVSPWAKNTLAYAVKNELVVGAGSTTTLDPQGAFTGNQVALILLRQLGYADTDYSKAADVLASKGGLTADEATKFASKNLIRDDAVGMMFGSLKAQYADGKTIIEKLVASGVVTEAAAIAAGVYTAAPAVPAVTGISATNLKELVVTFNAELNKTTAETAGNYTVAGNAAQSATLGADKKTVTVVVPDAYITTNGSSYDVVVKKAVANAAGVGMAADYSAKVRVIDNTLPDATSITLTGPQTFDITFNEPIKTAGTIKVNNGIYGVTNVTTGTTITVTLAASQLPDGSYTINVSGFKDYAGFEMIAEDMTLAYAKPTDAVTASITSASQTKVVVAFNRPVKLPAGHEKEYFYQTYTAWQPTTASSADGGKTWTLEFGTYYVSPGTTNLVVRYSANSTALTDYWGNALAADIVLPITVTADTTPPTVLLANTKVTAEDTMVVYFSEDMNQSLVEDESNFTVKDSTGTKVTTSFTNTYTSDAANSSYYVTIKFAAKLSGGNYTVEMANLTDTSLAANKLVTIAIPFTVTDLTAINPNDITVSAIAGATSSDSEVFYVTFPEKPATTGQFSALSGDNYILDIGNGTTVSSITSLNGTLELFGASGKVVKITTPNIPGFTINAGVSNAKVTIGRIGDLAGNVYTYPLSITTSLIPVTAAPHILSVRLTDSNKVEIRMDTLLKSVLADAFVITGAGLNYKIAGIDTWGEDPDVSGTTLIKATLSADTVTALAGLSALNGYTTKTSISFTNAPGVDFKMIGQFVVSEAGQAASDTTKSALDYRKPVVLSVTTNGAFGLTTTGVAIQFSESLDNADPAWYGNDLIVKKIASDGSETLLTPGTGYKTVLSNSVAGNNSVISIVAVNGDALAAGTYKVSTKDTITYIKDATAGINSLATPYTTVTTVVVP